MRPHLLALAVVTVLFGCNRTETTFTPDESIEPLDTDWGSWLSMDVTPDGRLAAAYYDRTHGALGFAVAQSLSDDEVVWRHEEVDGYTSDEGMDVGDRGRFASMKVAPDGTVWIAYRDDTNGGLRVARRLGPDRWESEVADPGTGMTPDGGYWASLALDADGDPVVAHQDGTKGVLRVAHYSDGAWSAETAYEGQDWSGTDPTTGDAITRPANVGQFARMLFKGSTEYIAFYNAATQSLDVVEGFPGAYAHSVIYSDVDVGQWPDVWTDGTDVLFSFHDVANQDLLLARQTPSGFDVEVVDDGEFVGADSEIVYRDGSLQIVYFDGRNNDLKLATEADGAWTLEHLAGDDRAIGFHNEVVQVGDTWWVGSYDYTDRTVWLHTL